MSFVAWFAVLTCSTTKALPPSAVAVRRVRGYELSKRTTTRVWTALGAQMPGHNCG
jgi:hypothetical protein